ALNAEYNWWGAVGGPDGGGDGVSLKVDFDPWLVEPVEYDRNEGCTGTIKVFKEVTSGDPTTSFEFDPSWSDINFSLQHGQNANTPLLPPGTYSIEEINLPPGWS